MYAQFLTNDPTASIQDKRRRNTVQDPKPCRKKQETSSVSAPKSVRFANDDYIATCIKTGLPVYVNDECDSDTEDWDEEEKEEEKDNEKSAQEEPECRELTEREIRRQRYENAYVEYEICKAEHQALLLREDAIKGGWMDFALHVRGSLWANIKLRGKLYSHQEILIGSYLGEERQYVTFKERRGRVVNKLSEGRYEDCKTSMSGIEYMQMLARESVVVDEDAEDSSGDVDIISCSQSSDDASQCACEEPDNTSADQSNDETSKDTSGAVDMLSSSQNYDDGAGEEPDNFSRGQSYYDDDGKDEEFDNFSASHSHNSTILATSPTVNMGMYYVCAI